MSLSAVNNSTMPPHSEAWLEQRRKGIGGSDVHNLFPVESKWGCALRLWFDKTNTTPDYGRTEQELAILRRGTLLEDTVAELYADETGRRVFRSNTPIIHKEFPWMAVNIDRRIKADERGPGVLECKTAGFWIMKDIRDHGLPIAYALQLQHALAVTGYQWGSFAVFEPTSGQFLYWDVERDEKLIDLLTIKEREFWTMVQNDVRPAALADAKDNRCKSCQFRRTCRGAQFAALNQDIAKEVLPTEFVEDNSDALVQKAVDLKKVNEVLEHWESVKEQIVEEIKTELGDRVAVKVPDAGVQFIYKPRKGSMRWDTRALEADHPELTDKYKKPGAPTRPFTFHIVA